ncbi:MAG TPA: lysylphosphatidylglycerol synthase transmembrane domain-containing protein, partial [Acidimicrobiales bacterium]|nr:lysylphosphatidylglycerol synthase transmembrane domain-containing protein [Acidimicrobiales bacterium]
VGRRGMLIAQHLVDGTPLDAVAEAGNEDAVVAAWRAIASLHAAGIAHGPLDASDILIDVAGRPWLVDMDHASLGAPAPRRARDIADLLTSTAMVIGPDRAIAAAAAGLEPADLATCLPYLQRLALSPRIRRRLRRHWGLLEALRVAVVATTGAENVPLEKLERFSRKTVIRFALVFLVLYFLLPQLGSLEDAVSALGGADWRYIALAFIYIPTNYFAAGLRMVGSIPERLPFGPVYTLQMASAFMNRVTPNNVGGMTLTVRFLQKTGVPTQTAAASVGIQSVMTWAGLLAWLTVFFVWAGRTGSLGFDFPVRGVVLLVILAAIVVGAILWVIPASRRKVIEPVSRFARQAWRDFRRLLSMPGRLGLLGLGSLLDPIVDVVAFVWLLKAFSIDLPFAQAGALYLGGSTIGDAVPVPGGLGATDAALIAGLAGAGVDLAIATSCVLVYRLISYWMVIAPGWVCLEILRRLDYV